MQKEKGPEMLDSAYLNLAINMDPIWCTKWKILWRLAPSPRACEEEAPHGLRLDEGKPSPVHGIKDPCDPNDVTKEESQTEEKNDVEHEWHLGSL